MKPDAAPARELAADPIPKPAEAKTEIYVE